MVQSRFDPTDSVQFDLNRGRVALDGSDSRFLIPTTALMALCRNAGEDSVRDFGRLIGTEAGRRVAERLRQDVQGASVEQLIEHLGGDLALIGFGSLASERWGRALVLTIDGSPLGPEGDALAAAVLEGALQRALNRTTSIVVLQRDGSSSRFLVLNAEAATKVRSWLAAGTSWGDVLTRLNAGRGEA